MAIPNPALSFCAVDGCYEVGTGQPRSRQHCGPHYRSVVLANIELVKCEVVGQFPIVDARTGDDVPPGGVVELDPEGTNIPALIAGGHVRVIPPKAAKSADEKKA